jgi:hypothetical protein
MEGKYVADHSDSSKVLMVWDRFNTGIAGSYPSRDAGECDVWCCIYVQWWADPPPKELHLKSKGFIVS